MENRIESVAVLGGGTMGLGIAAACADAGAKVLLLDLSLEACGKALDRMVATRQTSFPREELDRRIQIGTLGEDLGRIAGYDWVCEAVIEDLPTKRELFSRLEPLRRVGSVVSTNTSGIPLRAITQDLPASLRQDIVVTHFFNPVKVMKLMELVPGADTRPAAADSLAAFCRDMLGKGVVHAKDTVNFIGNRIGCFWMLAGLHKALKAQGEGLSMEQIDALMSAPVGLPSTGLYGLIDLIGLDVMDFVGKNLEINLPAGDVGHAFIRFPVIEQAMLERGQLGRKSGGGFYRISKDADGGKVKEVYDLSTQAWRPAVAAKPAHGEAAALLFAEDAAGRFAWDLMGTTLCYAADLVPEIADDIVSIDRAMRWGFNWKQGPFEMLDSLDPHRVVSRLEAEGRKVPAMLEALCKVGAASFYRDDLYLGLDGQFHSVPAE